MLQRIFIQNLPLPPFPKPPPMSLLIRIHQFPPRSLLVCISTWLLQGLFLHTIWTLSISQTFKQLLAQTLPGADPEVSERPEPANLEEVGGTKYLYMCSKNDFIDVFLIGCFQYCRRKGVMRGGGGNGRVVGSSPKSALVST